MKKLFLFVFISIFLVTGISFAGPTIHRSGVKIMAPLEIDHNVELLNADRTVLITDKPIQWYDCNGTDRNVVLPAEASSTDLVFTIYNDSDGAGEDLVIRDDTPTTLITIGPGQGTRVSCDGTSWKVLNNKGIKYDGIAHSTIFPQENDALTPTLSFGDGNTGFYEEADNDLCYTRAGTIIYKMGSGETYSTTAGGFNIKMPLAATATTPVYRFSGDNNTGIGRAAADQLSFIVGGIELMRLTQNDAATDVATINEQLSMAESSAPGALADHVFFYGANVSGIAEAFAADAAANAAQLTPHNFDLFEPDSLEAYPWSYYAENRALGIKINVDMAGAIRAVEGLTGKTFIYTQNISKEVDLEKVYKDKWIADYIKAGIQEIETTKAQALETVKVDADKWYEVEIVDPETDKVTITKKRKKIGEKITGYELVDNEVKPKVEILWETEKVDKIQVKASVRFDEINGKFYTETKPSKAQAITAATTGFEFSPPKWLGDRLKK